MFGPQSRPISCFGWVGKEKHKCVVFVKEKGEKIPSKKTQTAPSLVEARKESSCPERFCFSFRICEDRQCPVAIACMIDAKRGEL